MKYIKILVLIITIILIYTIYNKTANKDNIIYVNLGDGYAMGINSYEDINYGYGDYLKKYLDSIDRLKMYYDDFNYKDMLIRDLRKDIIIGSSDKYNLKQVLREANLLTLSIGINDIFYKNNLNKYEQGKIVASIMTDFDLLIKEIRKYYKFDIYIIGYNNLDGNNKSLLNDLNKEYKKYSKKNNLKFIDVNNIDKYYDNPNSIYPNSNGYKEIYRNLIVKIDKSIKNS